MSLVDNALIEDMELRRMMKFRPCNVQPGFVPKDPSEDTWILKMDASDISAYLRGDISGEQLMKRNREKMAAWGIHVCPYYALVEICTQLAGITPEELVQEPKFCGLQGKAEGPGFSPIPFVSYPNIDLRPRSMCRKVYDLLAGRLAFVQQERPEELSREVKLGDLSVAELAHLRDVITAYVVRGTTLDPEQIVQEWRKVIFEVCSIPASELDNADVPPSVREHCRPLASPDELPQEEVIHKAQAFLGALMNNVLGSEKWFNRPAEKCLYAPQRDSGPIIHTSL